MIMNRSFPFFLFELYATVGNTRYLRDNLIINITVCGGWVWGLKFNPSPPGSFNLACERALSASSCLELEMFFENLMNFFWFFQYEYVVHAG